TRHPTVSPLFPYTTLFRSKTGVERAPASAAVRAFEDCVTGHCVQVRSGYRVDRHHADKDIGKAGGCARPRISTVRALEYAAAGRSEEHTSELQSPCNLVCR